VTRRKNSGFSWGDNDAVGSGRQFIAGARATNFKEVSVEVEVHIAGRKEERRDEAFSVESYLGLISPRIAPLSGIMASER